MTDTTALTVLLAPAHVLVDQHREGSEYNWPYRLAQRLVDEHGFNVVAIVGQAHVDGERPELRYLPLDAEGPLPMGNIARLLFHLRVYMAVRRVLAHEPIDIVHHMLPFGFRTTFNVYALLRHRSQPPLVVGPLQTPLSYEGGDEARVAVRDFAPSAVELTPRRQRPSIITFAMLPLLTALCTRTVQRAQARVAISSQAAHLYGAMSSRALTVIPAGVDTQEFAPSPWRSDDPDRPLCVIAVGYLVRRKAFDVLIRALPYVQAYGVAVRLRLIGDGPERQRLEQLAVEGGVRALVDFVGLVPHADIVHEYQRADLFCSTSWSESFSIVGLEAMACGLPVVATPTGFFRDVLQREAVGFPVRFGDPESLATVLVRCARDEELRRSMGKEARLCAVREYDWSVVAAQYAALYRSLVQRPKRAMH